MEPILGAIFSFGFNFAPVGWAQCNGQIMSISQNTALFSLLGTTYGGDGVTTFGLPNMQGRVPIGWGQGPGLPNYVIGQMAGAESVTLTNGNLPAHTHQVLTAQIPVNARSADQNDPVNGYFGPSDGTVGAAYASSATAGVHMATDTGNTGVTGSSLPLGIMSPFLVINYCIATEGIFPSRN